MNATASTHSRLKVGGSAPRARWVLALAVLPATLGLLACSGGGEADAQASAAPPVPRSLAEREQQPEPRKAPLEVSPAEFDLGRVPLQGGKVEVPFRVRNESAEILSLRGVYTSCACTTAVLQFADGSEAGPFGMPGHDLPIALRRDLQPQEELEVRAIFDPAFHGLDGVGKVLRVVYLHAEDGSIATLPFTAEVVIQ